MRYKHTIDEIKNMDGHVELIDGEIVITDVTSFQHNDAVYLFENAIRTYIKDNNGPCKVGREQLGIWFDKIPGGDKYNFFMPDIMVICPPKEVFQYGTEYAPDLVIEVVSPSSRTYDYNQKRKMYKKIGVREYWIIDSERKAAIQHLIEVNNFEPQTFYNASEISIHIFNDELVIDLSELFE